jgi:hypothetical protein
MRIKKMSKSPITLNTDEQGIKLFNTGNPYTSKGQRIAYQIIAKYYDNIWECETYEIIFLDFDRDITGTLDLMCCDNDSVYQAYADGGYENGFMSDPAVISLRQHIIDNN